MEGTHRFYFDDEVIDKFEKLHDLAVTRKDFLTATIVTNTLAELYNCMRPGDLRHSYLDDDTYHFAKKILDGANEYIRLGVI